MIQVLFLSSTEAMCEISFFFFSDGLKIPVLSQVLSALFAKSLFS